MSCDSLYGLQSSCFEFISRRSSHGRSRRVQSRFAAMDGPLDPCQFKAPAQVKDKRQNDDAVVRDGIADQCIAGKGNFRPATKSAGRKRQQKSTSQEQERYVGPLLVAHAHWPELRTRAGFCHIVPGVFTPTLAKHSRIVRAWCLNRNRTPHRMCISSSAPLFLLPDPNHNRR